MPAAISATELIGYSRMLLASGESERILCEFGDGLGCEPERLCDIGRASRHAETIDPEGNALIADPTGPAESCGGFDGHARAVTSGGSTSSRYDCGCLAKSVQHGMETTRVSMPRPSSSFFVSSASETSDPVAIKTRSGDPFASAIT